MAKFQITVMRPEDDQKRGLRPIAQLIENGLSSLVSGQIETIEEANAYVIEFEQDPETIESTWDGMEDPDGGDWPEGDTRED